MKLGGKYFSFFPDLIDKCFMIDNGLDRERGKKGGKRREEKRKKGEIRKKKKKKKKGIYISHLLFPFPSLSLPFLLLTFSVRINECLVVMTEANTRAIHWGCVGGWVGEVGRGEKEGGGRWREEKPAEQLQEGDTFV